MTGYVATETSLSASDVCEQLRAELDSVIVLPSDYQYSNLRAESWSQTAWKRPTYIALPASSSDVKSLVRVLVAEQVPFALRSGG